MKKYVHRIFSLFTTALLAAGALAFTACGDSSDSDGGGSVVGTAYTITYSTEHGTAPEAVTLYADGYALYLSSAYLPELTATGYAFGGWYDGETKVVAGQYRVTGNVTLTAKWTAVTTYTVTFNTNGGSTVDAQTVNTGAKATEPTTPTKSGYSFAGWYSDEAFTNEFRFTTEITADITLYAKWVISGTAEEVAAAITALKDRADTTTQNITVTGAVTSESIANIKAALQTLNGEFYTASAKIALDLSAVTGLTELAGSAFYNCLALTSVTLPSTVTAIGSNAFWLCRNLASVNIPSGVTSIGYAAFCTTELKSVTIPYTVTSIGGNAFAYCTELESVSLYAYADITELDGTFNGCKKLTSVTIPYYVTKIGNSTFYQTAITSITIPTRVSEIGYKAFSESALTSVTIPDNGASTIGISAFENCTSLTEVTIGNYVKSIGSYAFKGCTALTTAKFTSNTSWTTNDGVTTLNDVSNTSTNATYLATTYTGSWTRSN